MIHRIPDIFDRLLSRRLYSAVFCLTAGALAALSMAPLNAWPVLFISLPVLYASIVFARGMWSALLFGWLFGFGYFVCSLSWIGNALLVEGNPYQWAWPLAVSGLPALLAFFPALAMLLAYKFMNLRSLTGWLGFVSLYCGFEWLRGHLFTGFPWNLFGYTWADHLPVLQILWLSDVYTLTWLTLLWASAMAGAVFITGPRRRWPLVLAGMSFVGCYVYGMSVLPQNVPMRDDVRVRIVQPNIDQAEKWQPGKLAEHFQTHLELSKATETTSGPTIIVWPETAVSYRILETPQAMEDLRRVLAAQPENSVLLTGFLRRDYNDDSYANSLIMIDRQGAVSNIYDKHHLVPFGEYIPFQKWIPLAPVVQFKGFQVGAGLHSFDTPSGLRYSPLICYEIIFPGRSIAPGTSPDFIVNVTNDAWYGDSAGPHQHLTQALFRAIETGVPVMRSANTGISAVISPYGHIIERTQLFDRLRIETYVPEQRSAKFFAFHDRSPLSLVILLFFTGLGGYTGRRFSKAG